MIKHAIRAAVSGAFVVATLVSASTAFAHEVVTRHWAPRDLEPNDTNGVDWSATVGDFEYLSIHATSNATGVVVTTTKERDESFLYSFIILLKCSDDVHVEVWPHDNNNAFENGETVDLACNAGATLLSAALGVDTITAGHGDGDTGEPGEPSDGGEGGDTGDTGETGDPGGDDEGEGE